MSKSQRSQRPWLLCRPTSRLSPGTAKQSPWRRRAGLLFVGATFASFVTSVRAKAATLEWTRYIATPGLEGSAYVSADGLGTIYVAGLTSGNLVSPAVGGPFLAKFDESGNRQWTRQLGVADSVVYGVAAGRQGNNIYTAGTRHIPFTQYQDGYVANYNAAGSLLWTRQFGGPYSENVGGIAADSIGNVYVSGSTEREAIQINGYPYYPTVAFVRKYDLGGNLVWNKELGAGLANFARGVSVDNSGNLYVSGSTGGDLAGPNAGRSDAFVAKYDTAGNLQWTRQFGSTELESVTVAADELGNVWLAGEFGGRASNLGGDDPFLVKFDAAGNLLWTNPFGLPASPLTPYRTQQSLAPDHHGNVYVAGTYDTPSPDFHVVGRSDAYLAKFDGQGQMLWREQFGSPDVFDSSYGVSADGHGNVYLSGSYERYYAGPVALGDPDAFLMKFSDPVPEPNSLLLLGLVAIALAPRGRGSRRRNSIHDSLWISD